MVSFVLRSFLIHFHHQTLDRKSVYLLAAPVHSNSIIIITIYRFNHFDPIFPLCAFTNVRAYKILSVEAPHSIDIGAMANKIVSEEMCAFNPRIHTNTRSPDFIRALSKYRAQNIVSITEINRTEPSNEWDLPVSLSQSRQIVFLSRLVSSIDSMVWTVYVYFVLVWRTYFIRYFILP